MVDINELIESNIGLVYMQLKKFNRAWDEDAYSYALEALGRAAMNYRPDKNTAFATYASVCIYNGIAMYLRDLKRASKLQVVSYDYMLDDKFSVLDTLLGPNDSEDCVLGEELNNHIWATFCKVRDGLSSDIAKQVIDVWAQSDFTMKQGAIAANLGISQGHVSRTLGAFKHKLKKELEEYLCC